VDVIKIMEEIAQGTATATWTVVDRLVLHEGRLFVSSSSLLWPKHLATAHGAGHKGVQKTLQRLHVSYSPNAMYLVSRGKSRNKFRGGFLLLPLLRGLHWISSGRGARASPAPSLDPSLLVGDYIKGCTTC
jgi:hypothetical protein